MGPHRASTRGRRFRLDQAKAGGPVLGGSGEANEKLIGTALESGAVGAKLAGAGGGGTILALTFDPARTRQALLAAGADKILIPEPSPGLTVERHV